MKLPALSRISRRFRRSVPAICPLVLAMAPAALMAQSSTYYSRPLQSVQQRELPENRAVGFIRVNTGSSAWRGSGVVARHPQLIYSCAHVVWDEGIWVAPSHIEFHRGLHEEDPPGPGGVNPRGLLYFTQYSRAAREDDASPEAFDLDFALLYGNDSFGPPAAYHPAKGGKMLDSARSKKIAGYPAEVIAWEEDDASFDGHFHLHSTNPFTLRGVLFRDRERYFDLDDVTTGPGNSGGPVYVQGGGGVYGLAAILVSGNETSSGLHALDSKTYAMGTDALGRVGINARIKKTFTDNRNRRIPTGHKKYWRRVIRAKGFVGHIHELQVEVNFANRTRKQLQVFLKAPSGRTRAVVRGKDAKQRKIEFSEDWSNRYRLSQANGAWRLLFRDRKEGGKPAIYRNFSVTISD